jgi:copper oxidase (laccase) domain-containing protein
MAEEYGSIPEDIEVTIGPAINQCCFEVDEDVYTEFKNTFAWIDECTIIKKQGKWNINLQEIIRKTLIESGINEEKLCLSTICTMCNNDLFFSHRGDRGKTGSLAAIMQLKEK